MSHVTCPRCSGVTSNIVEPFAVVLTADELDDACFLGDSDYASARHLIECRHCPAIALSGTDGNLAWYVPHS